MSDTAISRKRRHRSAGLFKEVLIGVDGHQGGRDAIALARQLAAPGAALTLAHVFAPFPGRGAAGAMPIERAEAQQILEQQRKLAAVDAQLLVRGLPPVGRGLHELAEEQRADLLVVGSAQCSLLGRVRLGDECRATLGGAPCAVAVAPRGYALGPHRLQRLGVGYDGSAGSERALTAARELAALHESTVKAFRVVTLEEVREDEPMPADWPGAIDEPIERHTEQLAQLDGVRGVVTYGGPREELTQAGKELDLLIVGSRGYGPVGRLVHGSVPQYLVGHATCPLLVLPRQAVGTDDLSPEAVRDTHAAMVAGR